MATQAQRGHDPVVWAARMRRALVLGFGALGAALGIGVLGYHLIAGLPWIDALLNAAMILGGMGPVDQLSTTGGKLFAAGYALFSGLLFVGVCGVIAAPWVHLFLHRFHAELDDADDD
ncbi:MAG: hypothetical protein JNL07_12745 [Rhodospirillales bacterium]|nr:hypothetical protein [Rhodospirillales bacterium]